MGRHSLQVLHQRICALEHSKSKGMAEKECDHVDKNACFQPHNSENLNYFCVSMRSRGERYCEEKGNVVFFVCLFLIFGHMCCAVYQVLQTLTHFYTSLFFIISET